MSLTATLNLRLDGSLPLKAKDSKELKARGIRYNTRPGNGEARTMEFMFKPENMELIGRMITHYGFANACHIEVSVNGWTKDDYSLPCHCKDGGVCGQHNSHIRKTRHTFCLKGQAMANLLNPEGLQALADRVNEILADCEAQDRMVQDRLATLREEVLPAREAALRVQIMLKLFLEERLGQLLELGQKHPAMEKALQDELKGTVEAIEWRSRQLAEGGERVWAGGALELFPVETKEPS